MERYPEMEEDILSTTLAYKKSPKTSKRTSFQDELQAAITARARKMNTEESYSYADDFDDDDALEQLLSLRKKKMDTFRAGKKKAVEFKVSDEDQKSAKPKRVSFMKTRRKGSPTPSGSSDLGYTERGETESGVSGSRSGSSQSSRSDRSGPKSVQFRLEPSTSDGSRSASPGPPSSQRSEERQEVVTGTEENWGEVGKERQETPTDGERWEKATGGKGKETETDGRRPVGTPIAEDKEGLTRVEKEAPVPQPRERNVRKSPRSGSPLREERPKPRPRQRPPGEGSQAEESAFGGEVSRPPTSSVSIPLSSADRASSASSAGETEAFRDPSPQRTEEDRCISSRFSQCSSSRGQLSDTYSRSTDALDGLPEQDKQGSKDEYSSTSFEVNQEDDERDLNSGNSGQSHSTDKSHDNSSQGQSKKRPKSALAQAAESRYLGALKVLDDLESQIKSQPDMADSVRATVYQEWLKSKQKVIKEAIKVKKLEEQLIEEKKQQEEASRKVDAKSSFAAWNEKKAETIKAKLKEKQEVMKKLQQEMEEKAEKKEMAKKAFEKWKTGQDEYLKEKYRKQKEAEQKLKQKKEEEEEERKRNCTSTLSEWSHVKKKDILVEVRRKRREEKIKEEEEKYMKEEKEKEGAPREKRADSKKDTRNSPRRAPSSVEPPQQNRTFWKIIITAYFLHSVASVFLYLFSPSHESRNFTLNHTI
ncbi:microtubule-associated protein 9 isoform X1 [Anguilla anguilla]|uniref:microtubule-associated protein 9 isoform X1 n=2 Tax=Anguilla anguilla TaxID=7936 RepID=UPI0015ADA644|nr:microtubule-associated protein 9 isoform X1 [Anguilla anguilla]